MPIQEEKKSRLKAMIDEVIDASLTAWGMVVILGFIFVVVFGWNLFETYFDSFFWGATSLSLILSIWALLRFRKKEKMEEEQKRALEAQPQDA